MAECRAQLEDWWDSVAWRARQGLAALRYRPLFKCPFCNGAGGAMEGYYEPEWCECLSCYRYWEPLEDRGMGWFIGRLPALAWCRAHFSVRAKMNCMMPLNVLVRCKIGMHCDWLRVDPETQVCNACFESRKKSDGARRSLPDPPETSK